MMFTRVFAYAHRRADALGSFEWVPYWTIEGSVGIIDIFDREGRPTINREVWAWAEQLKTLDRVPRRT